MLTILLHSSKTMRPLDQSLGAVYQAPLLLDAASSVVTYIRGLSSEAIESSMKLSPAMAEKTYELFTNWSASPSAQRPAIDAFLGDIYSGLRAQSFSDDDREYANNHLLILSGLYGVLRALDSIAPYRLEMGYRLPDEPYKNLYKFWDKQLASVIPEDTPIINLSAVEYTKAVFPYLPPTSVIITPKFLTISPKSGVPVFVTVHAKIARGAFARWLIQNKISSPETITKFSDIGYSYSPELSTADQPVFVCKKFEGIGLSVRLT